MALGIGYPFTPASGSNSYFGSVDTVSAAIAQNARSLLSTNWGERVMRPDFGCNLREFCFEQQIQQTRQRIADRIVEQFTKWMPFVRLVVIGVTFGIDDKSLGENGMRVSLKIEHGNLTIEVVQEILP